MWQRSNFRLNLKSLKPASNIYSLHTNSAVHIIYCRFAKDILIYYFSYWGHNLTAKAFIFIILLWLMCLTCFDIKTESLFSSVTKKTNQDLQTSGSWNKKHSANFHCAFTQVKVSFIIYFNDRMYLVRLSLCFH